jgi:AhpD family alkylhydroperoxidase
MQMEIKMNKTTRILIIASALAFGHMSAQAEDTSLDKKAVYADITKAFGAVPTFVTQLPDAALQGFWLLEKDLELSEKTALPGKTKALIALAVAAQIPCDYCIWSDTITAKQLGATDAEIGEAVAMAALTRYSSTTLNGLQVDKVQFKKEMGIP